MSDSLTLFVSIFLWFRSSLLFSLSGIASSSGSHLRGDEYLLFLFQPKPPPSCFSTAPALNPDAQRMEKIQKMYLHVPLGMSTIYFYSNRCHISTFLKGSHAMRE